MGFTKGKVPKYRFPHKVKFKGVIIIEERSATAVKLTDNAIFPFARDVIKFEIFPPGQDATRSIPKDIETGNLAMIIKRKVIPGSNTN